MSGTLLASHTALALGGDRGAIREGGGGGVRRAARGRWHGRGSRGHDGLIRNRQAGSGGDRRAITHAADGSKDAEGILAGNETVCINVDRAGVCAQRVEQDSGMEGIGQDLMVGGGHNMCVGHGFGGTRGSVEGCGHTAEGREHKCQYEPSEPVHLTKYTCDRGRGAENIQKIAISVLSAE